MSNPGEAAEAEVLAVIKVYFPDAKGTRGSGNVHGDGDIAGTPVHVEVKDQTTGDGFTIKRGEWLKSKQQALRWDKLPVLVVRNKFGELKAVCDLDLLMLALSYIPEGTL
jgi:hypothetical protein